MRNKPTLIRDGDDLTNHHSIQNKIWPREGFRAERTYTAVDEVIVLIMTKLNSNVGISFP